MPLGKEKYIRSAPLVVIRDPYRELNIVENFRNDLHADMEKTSSARRSCSTLMAILAFCKLSLVSCLIGIFSGRPSFL